MDERSIFHQMRHWGYFLLPRSHLQSPGYSGLLVAIREVPTEEHYDPQLMRVRIVDSDKQVRCVKFRSKGPFDHSITAVIGRVSLLDRVNKRVDFFTFGGLIEHVCVRGAAFYFLSSPAPVLELNGQKASVAKHFANEIEAMIAVQKAKWGANTQGLFCKLCELNPFRLYLLCLQWLIHHDQQNTILHRQYLQPCAALIHEKEWLLNEGLFPDLPYDLNHALEPV